MNTNARRTKVSATLPNAIVSEIDELVESGSYESRSAAFEAAAKKLLRERVDALIEAEVLKLDREAEKAEAEQGIRDFAALLRE